jgi:hypothetical protein
LDYVFPLRCSAGLNWPLTSGKNLLSKFGGNLVRGFIFGQSGQIWAKNAKLVAFPGLACFDLLVEVYSYSGRSGTITSHSAQVRRLVPELQPVIWLKI